MRGVQNKVKNPSPPLSTPPHPSPPELKKILFSGGEGWRGILAGGEGFSVGGEGFFVFLTLPYSLRAVIFTYFSMGEGKEMIFFQNNKQPKKYVGVSGHWV